MVRVFEDGDWLKATTISGPAHNCLALVLSMGDTPCAPIIEVVRLPAEQSRPDRVLQKAVTDAIEGINREHGSRLRVERIQYIPTDSPRMDNYGALARALGDRYLEAAKPPLPA